MKNIAIQTKDGESICFYTTSMERAREIVAKAEIEIEEIYEVKDEDMEFHHFDSRLWDPLIKKERIKK